MTAVEEYETEEELKAARLKMEMKKMALIANKKAEQQKNYCFLTSQIHKKSFLPFKKCLSGMEQTDL